MVRRVRLLVAATVVVTALGVGSVAHAADSFRIYGSGYGHGIGMSQWGAYGLANKGWSYQRILTHFYSRTSVVESSTLPRRVRVGLTSGRRTIHLTAKNGPVLLWIDGPGTSFVAKIPSGKTWTVSAATTVNRYAIRNHNGALVGRRRWGGPARPLFATYPGGARVFVPEADEVWHRGFTYAYGFLEFDLFDCADGCEERLTLELPLERYLRGIGEMPSSWPGSALRSQAVAARTFATYKIRNYGLRSDCDCHLADGASDQVYVGWSKESAPDGDRWVAAVADTAGEVVTYGGAAIQAFYAASDGGHSEDVEDVWHGGNSAYAIPYLRGVCDPGEYTSANPWTDWNRSFTASTLSSRLSPYTGGIGTITRFTDVRRGISGRIVSAIARGTGGSASITGSELKAALGLPDGRIWINRDRNIIGAVRAKYDDLMCRPGLPASRVLVLDHGSRQLFESGGIYRNAQADLTVWLRGSVHTEYLGVGGATGRLGLPVSVPSGSQRVATAETCTGCRRLVLERGRIYFKPGLGAHALWGSVLSEYLSRGDAQGALGYPTTRVSVVDGVARASFEHGTISCSSGICQVS